MKKVQFLAIVFVLILLPACALIAAPKSAGTISIAADSLIKGQSFSTIYYYASDGYRYVFPNDKTYGSWFTDFSKVTTISDEELAKIPLKGNITYRPGVRMVKIQTSPKVYVVDQGGKLRWIETEELAKELYGDDWNQKIDDIPDVFFTNYKEGKPITKTEEYKPTTVVAAAATINDDKGIIKSAAAPKADTAVGSSTAIPATPATPHPGTGTPATPATPAAPAKLEHTTSTPNDNGPPATTPSGTSPATPATPAAPATPALNCCTASMQTVTICHRPSSNSIDAQTLTVSCSATGPEGHSNHNLDTCGACSSNKDTTPPSVPSGLIASSTSVSAINLSWTASADNVGVANYKVERCQETGCTAFVQIGASYSAAYADTGLSVGTTYVYRVRAADAAGNLSGYSASASATTQGSPPTTTGSCAGITSITDSRDTNNPVYETVAIGNQCWLKRNLNVGTRIDGNAGQTNDGVLEKYCYGNSNETNCNTHGGLYQWDEAMNYSTTEGAQGICPSGWHIPTDAEYKTLEMYLGMSQAQADATDWRGTTEGTKLKNGGTSGYNAPLGGIRYTDGHWDNLGGMESIWTSSLRGADPWMRYLHASFATSYRNYGGELYGHSVRCIKGEGASTTYPAPTQTPVMSSDPIPTQTSSCGGVTSVTDNRDTNNPTYETVAIGNQCWLKRNLNVGTRMDGGSNQTNNSAIEKYCYGNSESSCNTTGGLYQWDEAMNYSTTEGAQGICPSGWHIPTDAEWKTLEMNQGMSQEQADITGWRGTIEGDRLKNTGLCDVRTPCGSSGFAALLSGIRYTDGHWDNLNAGEMTWSSSLSGSDPWIRFMRSYSAMTSRGLMGKLYGLPVRCIKDKYVAPPVVTGCNGITSVTDSRDTTNPVYETVEIGNRCWLKRSLNIGTQIMGNLEQTNDGAIQKYCTYDSVANCTTYGALYQWNEAMNYTETEGAQGICLSGWHIPSATEWDTMATSPGVTHNGLKSATGWNGTDTTGFNALPAGQRYPGYGYPSYPAGTYGYLGDYVNFITSTMVDSVLVRVRFLSTEGSNSPGMQGTQTFAGVAKGYGHSVRCVKNQ